MSTIIQEIESEGMNAKPMPRFRPGDTVRVHVRIKEGLVSYLGEDIESIEAFVDLNSVWTDPDRPWVQRVFGLLTPMLGEPPPVAALPFFTDAAVLQPAFGDVQTIILGPGDTHMAHQTDEYCEVDRIPVAVEMYKAIIRDWYRQVM